MQSKGLLRVFSNTTVPTGPGARIMSWVLGASVGVRSGSWGPGADARGREQYSSTKDTERQQEALYEGH